MFSDLASARHSGHAVWNNLEKNIVDKDLFI